jgi:hypothetical protein
VVTCAAGNQYGVSNAAMPSYEKIIKGFSQKEIAIFLDLPATNTVIAQRLKSYGRCKNSFQRLVKLIDASSVPTKMKNAYDVWAV